MLKHKRKKFSGDRAKQSEAVHFPFNARLKCGNITSVQARPPVKLRVTDGGNIE